MPNTIPASSSSSSSSPTPTPRSLIAARGRVHLAGIGGIGMAGLAFHLKARGLAVSGCDASDGPNLEWLRARGIACSVGHDPAHAAGADWFIRSTAVPADSPEIAAARAAGLPVLRRGEVLPALLPDTGSAVIAGTHGKTTTTTFLTRLLQSAGRKPAFFVGGHVDGAGTMAGDGEPGLFVTEGDESDGTLALYAPDIAVVTNIEFDHMEHFADAAAFEACFTTFMKQARRVVYCADDPRAARLAAGLPGAVSYGFSKDAAIRAVDPEDGAARVSYTLVRNGEPLGRVELPVPGRHNILNSLGAAAAGFLLGLSFDDIRTACASFALPRRRFDRILDRPEVLVVSDYAHHPSEIRTAIQAARKQGRKRILAVYQPHRYTRTKALGPDFPPAFEGVDDLTLAPVYAASEKPLEGGTIQDLYRLFRESGRAPRLARTLREAWLDLRHRLEPGDLLLVMGAGDVEQIAAWAAEELAQAARSSTGRLWKEPAESVLAEPLPDSTVRLNEPLGIKTTYRVGGEADAWVEAGSEADLIALLKRTAAAGVPVFPMGGGSNLLIPDTGFRGIALRLSAAAFGAHRIEGTRVTVGPSCPAARLADAAEKAGLSGLEWLEGIPGRVGGLLRMNAGAHEGEIGGAVSWIRAADADGSIRVYPKEELVFEYRRCPALENRIILEAELVLAKGDPAAIRAKRLEIRGKREWMRGLHTAGSVFKNPPGDFAGRLIEEAGWKGKAVGGARVLERHANILAAEAGCTASDLLALIDLIRESVQRRSGIRLETEVLVPG